MTTVAKPAEKKGQQDAQRSLLDHCMAVAGIDAAALLEASVKARGKSEHDIDVVVNTYVLGHERPFFRALVRALGGS